MIGNMVKYENPSYDMFKSYDDEYNVPELLKGIVRDKFISSSVKYMGENRETGKYSHKESSYNKPVAQIHSFYLISDESGKINQVPCEDVKEFIE